MRCAISDLIAPKYLRALYSYMFFSYILRLQQLKVLGSIGDMDYDFVKTFDG